MKLNFDLLRTLLVIGSIFSCGMLALCILQIPSYTFSLEEIPFRFKIIIPICLLVLFLASYFSEAPTWKNFLKLVGYTICITLLGIVAYGIRTVIYNLFNLSVSTETGHGLLLICLGAGGIFIVIRCIKSKWLN
ncbi:MAG: hypothetical protein B0W54_12605 [Cellvibrio sp. 79]|nr:MAG: hypothetical protein B0W54_12605 [Cellvibrio sp. 79]